MQNWGDEVVENGGCCRMFGHWIVMCPRLLISFCGKEECTVVFTYPDYKEKEYFYFVGELCCGPVNVYHQGLFLFLSMVG